MGVNTLLANALRRALCQGEDEAVPRISDLDAIDESTAGKLEIEYAGSDRSELEVARDLVRRATRSVFDSRFSADDLGQSDKGRIFVKEDSMKINFSNQDEIIYFTAERWSGKTGKWRWHTGENLDNGDPYCGAVVYSYGEEPATDPELYLNGELVTDRDKLRSPTGSVDSDAGTDIFLGNSEGLNRTFDGFLDDFYFFDSILTLEEIQAIQP